MLLGFGFCLPRFALEPQGMALRYEMASRERIKLGGSTYLVEAFSEMDGFRTRWTCAQCGQSGHSAAKYSEVSGATAWGKVAASIHHLAMHADA